MILFAFLACVPISHTDTDTDVIGPSDSDTDSQESTAHTGQRTPVIDCRQLPTPTQTYLTAPRAYHGIAFDTLGNLIGSDGDNLIAASSPTEAQIWLPNLGRVEQIAFASDGYLYILKSFFGSSVGRISPQKVEATIMSGLGSAYGLTIGPDGNVYVADQSRILRLNITTGAIDEVLAPFTEGPKVVNFSPDGSKLYYGTVSHEGNIYVVNLDAHYNPVGNPQVFASAGGWHDGLEVDACGNLYVSDYETRALYRVSPSGRVRTLFSGLGSRYGHGGTFGSGVGAWDDHTLYQPLPYGGNNVVAVDVGVPDRAWRDGDYETIQ